MPPRDKQEINRTGILTAGITISAQRIQLLLQNDGSSRIETEYAAWHTYFSRFDGNLQGTPGTETSGFGNTSSESFARYYFALQTTLSIVFRLMVSRVLIDPDTGASVLSDLSRVANNQELLKSYARLETDELYRSNGWNNFLADDLYGWLHKIRSATTAAEIIHPVLEAVYNIVQPDLAAERRKLDYAQDIYQRKIDKSVRRCLGEYYTPEWLAEHVFNHLVPVEVALKKIIDPACGSGVFLLTALAHRKRQSLNSGPAKLIAGLTGFDINPLAVQAARMNIILFCSSLPKPSRPIEIPVHCADALTIKKVGLADFVIGNPPWIFWNNLPPSYRDSIEPLLEHYGLKAQKQSSMRRLGAVGKDISMLFFYRAMDKMLKPGGRLGFILTQSVLQSTAADEFRAFQLPDETSIGIERVEDWRKESPFAYDARNKTAVVYAQKGATTDYPVPYFQMSRQDGKIAEHKSFARPSDPKNRQSFWIISDSPQVPHIAENKIPYRPRLGIETKLESVFRVHILNEKRNGILSVINNRRRAKKPVPEYTTEIENDLVYPFVGGAGIRRWQAEAAGYYIVPHTPDSGIKAVPEQHLREAFPLTYAYFNHFKTDLSDRSLHKRWGAKQPFYAMYGIGPYTFAPYRVAWKRTTRYFAAVVLSTIRDEMLGDKLLLANGKVMIIPFENDDEAHFVCAVLNAAAFRERINNSITSEAHRDIINVIPWKKFDPALNYQQRLIAISKQLHELGKAGNRSPDWQKSLESDLDQIVKKQWKI